jgi:hypothetical protein
MLFTQRTKSTHQVILSVVAFICAILLVGCSSESDPEFTPENSSISYFSKSLDFTSEGGSATITFTTNKDWSVAPSSSGGDISWCTVSPSSGKAGTNTVTIKTSQNTLYDDRNVTLFFTVKDLITNLVITQKQKDALTITTAKYEVASAGGTINVEVKANIDYQIEIPSEYSSWIHQTSSRGLTASNIAFTIDKSEEYDKREGEIIVKSGLFEERLKIYQAGSGILLLSQNEYKVSSDGEDISVEISSNFEYGVEMPNADWITPIATRSLSSHTLYFKIAANETYDNREANIVFYDTNSLLTDTLRIIQSQINDIILSGDSYNIEAEGGEINVDVSANIDYTVNINVDWIEEINTRSLSSNNIIFKISEIPGSQDSREGTITFVNESTGITREINVKQINPFCVKTESIEILEGETANIELINNLEDKSVEWSSSNTSIATVDENGKIDAISKGSCTITIKSFDKKYTRVCVVSVKSITDYVKSKVMTVQFGSLSNGYFSGKISGHLQNPVFEKYQFIAIG